MALHPLAGKPAPRDLLVNIPRLISAYYTTHPDPTNIDQKVAFGTSGHRGSSFNGQFNEDHILAISQSICEYRQKAGITGPLYLGMDTHALSEAAQASAIEVFAANGAELFIQADMGYAPTPAISHAILTYNNGGHRALADGVVITPSHNPPNDGGFKYNPPEGGPAASETTKTIQDRVNQILADGLKAVKRLPLNQAMQASNVHHHDFMMPYVNDLANVIDMAAIANAGLKIGVDPMASTSMTA